MKYIWSFNWWIFPFLMVNFLNFPSDCVAYFSAAPSISQYVRFLIWQSFEWRAAPCTCSDWWKLPPPSQLLATDEIQLDLRQQQRWRLRGKWKRPPEKWNYLWTAAVSTILLEYLNESVHVLLHPRKGKPCFFVKICVYIFFLFFNMKVNEKFWDFFLH